jgi:hypothetical protein
MLEAIQSVLAGHAQRICKPGQWRVWRDGAKVIFERLNNGQHN